MAGWRIFLMRRPFPTLAHSTISLVHRWRFFIYNFSVTRDHCTNGNKYFAKRSNGDICLTWIIHLVTLKLYFCLSDREHYLDTKPILYHLLRKVQYVRCFEIAATLLQIGISKYREGELQERECRTITTCLVFVFIKAREPAPRSWRHSGCGI